MSPPNCDVSRWFSEEVQPHEPALRSYLRRHFPSVVDTDDLVQETYARLVRARLAGRVTEARPYLFATARNAACDVFRRPRTISLAELAETGGSSVVEEKPNGSEVAARAQELELLREAIGSLPDRCRQVLTLSKLYGLSHREVATRLGISEHTVHAQIAIGVLRCRNYFRQRGALNGGAP